MAGVEMTMCRLLSMTLISAWVVAATAADLRHDDQVTTYRTDHSISVDISETVRETDSPFIDHAISTGLLDGAQQPMTFLHSQTAHALPVNSSPVYGDNYPVQERTSHRPASSELAFCCEPNTQVNATLEPMLPYSGGSVVIEKINELLINYCATHENKQRLESLKSSVKKTILPRSYQRRTYY